MDDDQQFCLRWNNHQSTLISVFDTLLENETLVDCTLAAEGKFLKAHKVVLSACSPYFAKLLSEQYDKHPIFILKDVKYQELRAMMDYMYRGEVNISQDQLAALLKAAESLQIKGLSDNRSGGSGGGSSSQKSTVDHNKHVSVPGKMISSGSGGGGGVGGLGIGTGMGGVIGGGYTLEQTKRARVGPSSIDSQDMACSREGSSSPTSRRRRKIRRRSIENDIHENSNSSQIQLQQQPTSVPTQSNASTIIAGVSAITAAAAAAAGIGPIVGSASGSMGSVLSSATQSATSSSLPTSVTTQGSGAPNQGNLITTNVTKKTESVSKMGNTDAINTENIQDDSDKDMINKKDQQNHKQQQRLSKIIESSSSAVGKDTDMVIEPKSEYDDDGNDETVEDLTLDDEEMGLEDLDHNAGPSHGEGSSQGYAQWQVDRSQDEVFMAAQEAQQRDPQDVKYEFPQSLLMGDRYGERFPCNVCGKSYLRKRHLQRHMRDECIGIPPRFKCDLCPSRFRRKYHMVRHMTSKHGIPPPSSITAPNTPENLSMKKENTENYNVRSDSPACVSLQALTPHHQQQQHQLPKLKQSTMIAGSSSPLQAGALRSSPVMPMYGLSGAIATICPTSSSAGEDNDCEDIKAKEMLMTTVKTEPTSPHNNKNGGGGGGGINIVDEDWKMKLSLQLISNSLLKERLLNTMPYAYNNN